MNADDKYVSVAIAADLAGIPARTLRYWVEAKKLATVAGKHGRLVRMGDVDRVARQRGRASGNVLPASEGAAAIAADVATGPEIGPGVGPVVALVERAYREALAAKDREIAVKDELIAELRGRAERAERRLGESSGVEREGQQAPSPVSPQPGAGDHRALPLVQRIVRWWNGERNILREAPSGPPAKCGVSPHCLSNAPRDVPPWPQCSARRARPTTGKRMRRA